jgi:uncharacterized protein YjiS (DUF1127 family)
MERTDRTSMTAVLWAMTTAAAAWLLRVLQAHNEARARAAAAHELQHLSDRVLRDIGLQRSDLR